MSKIRIKQVKSSIGASKKQKATLIALGLRKISGVVEHNTTADILGMVSKVNHLIEVEKA